MTSKAPRTGPVLRVAFGVSRLLGPLAQAHLKRRVAKGKEDPKRWREKLGYAGEPRPDGPVVWMHGVGVGEVMALRGLIDAMADARPDLNFLVTSSARSSGDVFARNLPPRTQHQYLPLDVPRPVTRFLDHWKPDLAVWSDQEIWPRLAITCARRNIPQALVAARLTKKSTKAKSAFGDAYGTLFRMLDVRHAQDEKTAASLRFLMDDGTPVHVTGSLKAAAAPLSHDRALCDQVAQASGRPIWLAASAHRADIDIALDAHQQGLKQTGKRLLIIAPRTLDDADFIARACGALGLISCQRSLNALPDPDTDVFIADSFGELGAWYRIARAALIGGTFDATQGHNPWEAVALDCPVLHGPNVRNFANDYMALKAVKGARAVGNSRAVLRALGDSDLPQMAARARTVREQAAHGLSRITSDLLALLKV